ncbi:hypothetical protein [Actinoplanes ianthinogenes]|nr:hypothetical protein [Actinoplanes ianthinogenes]
MPLSEVLAAFPPTFGGATWKRAIPGILADPDSAQVVELLRAELVLHGGFTEPILVDARAREILDGMHRIAAAVLNEHDTLDLTEDEADLPEKRLVLATLAVPAMSSAAVDRLARALRSFPFAGGWTTCGMLFPGSDQVSGWWRCPPGQDTTLGAELVARATRAGVPVSLISITGVDEPENPE